MVSHLIKFQTQFFLSVILMQPIKLSSLLCLYDGLDPRAVKLGVAFKYWAKVYSEIVLYVLMV